MRKIFAFVFPFTEGGEFRCLKSFENADDASEWCARMLSVGEECHFTEVPSTTHVFEPATDAHYTIESHDDGWLVTNP